jgi:hypothetical protein
MSLDLLERPAAVQESPTEDGPPERTDPRAPEEQPLLGLLLPAPHAESAGLARFLDLFRT